MRIYRYEHEIGCGPYNCAPACGRDPITLIRSHRSAEAFGYSHAPPQADDGLAHDWNRLPRDEYRFGCTNPESTIYKQSLAQDYANGWRLVVLDLDDLTDVYVSPTGQAIFHERHLPCRQVLTLAEATEVVSQ